MEVIPAWVVECLCWLAAGVTACCVYNMVRILGSIILGRKG